MCTYQPPKKCIISRRGPNGEFLYKYKFLLQKGNFYCFQSFSCLQFLKNNQFKIMLMSKRHILGLHSLLPFNIKRYSHTPRKDKWGTQEDRYSSGNTHPAQGLCFLSSCISYFMLVLFLRKQMYKASAWLQEQ